MKSRGRMVILYLVAGHLTAFGQAAPTAVGPPGFHGFELPTLQGTLAYSLSASETANFGSYGNGGTVLSTNLSGNLGYLSQSKSHATSLVLAAGYLSNANGQASTVYERMSATQSLRTRNWDLSLTDSVDFLPETPTTGLSGIPGVGDLGVSSSSPSNSSQSVLTGYATRVDNNLSGTAMRTLTGKTSIQASGSWGILRFTGNSPGVESDQTGSSVSLNRRIDARDNAGVNYTYSHFSYLGAVASFDSQSAGLQFSRLLTRKISVTGSIGPQWTGVSSGESGGSSSLDYTASAHLSYSGRSLTSSLNYMRFNNTGSGVSLGAETDFLSLNMSRRVGRSLQCTGSFAYSHSVSLAGLSTGSLTTQSVVGSVQASRALGRNFFAFASYTVEEQSFAGTSVTLTPFSGVNQILGFGISFSPATIRLRSQ